MCPICGAGETGSGPGPGPSSGYRVSTEVLSTVEDELKQEDLERPFTTAHPSGTDARPTITISDHSATPTESLIHSYEEAQPSSHERTDATEKILHTMFSGKALGEQDDSRLEEATTLVGPSNPLSCLSPINVPSITRADNENVSESDSDSRLSGRSFFGTSSTLLRCSGL